VEDKTAPEIVERARAVRMMIFDVDGVLTDGRLYYTDAGDELKAFSTLDGHGLRMLMDSGVATAIITGRRSGIVEHRARNLGIDHVFQGVKDKGAAVTELARSLGLAREACGFMGDDLVDLPAMRRCGFAVATSEAPDVVRERAHFVATRAAGAGAVREVCELLMRAQGTLESALAPYLEDSE